MAAQTDRQTDIRTPALKQYVPPKGGKDNKTIKGDYLADRFCHLVSFTYIDMLALRKTFPLDISCISLHMMI